jgi:hypothetical protein
MRRVLASLVLLVVVGLPPRAIATGERAPSPEVATAGVPGDFNRDGFADLAVGIPGDDGAEKNAGAVSVIRGGPNGLTSNRTQHWTEDTPGVPGGAKPGEAFGSALVTGDFNGDRFADLAVGAPSDLVNGIQRAGAVVVLYGSRFGLRQRGGQQWTQDSPGVGGTAGRDYLFGASLAAGDFNGDRFADLAVGAPQQIVRGRFSAGSVTVLYGAATGLSARRDQVFTQETAGIGGRAGDLHLFGWSLAAANFGRGAAADLAVGAPVDSVGAVQQAGSVIALYGSTTNRLRASTSQRWSQDNFRVIDRAQRGDLFGWSLAAGNLGRSGLADLAIGVPGEDLPGASDAGAVNVLFGRQGGLAPASNQFRTQNSNGIRGSAAAGDAFGSALAAGDFGLTRFADLAIGVPGEDVRNHPNAGAINVIYGSRRGLVPRGNQRWTRASPRIVGRPQGGEGFGSALAAQQFGHGRPADLAAGMGRHNVGLVRDGGGVAVLYGSPEGLRSGGNQLWTRANPGITGTPHAGDRFGRAVA